MRKQITILFEVKNTHANPHAWLECFGGKAVGTGQQTVTLFVKATMLAGYTEKTSRRKSDFVVISWLPGWLKGHFFSLPHPPFLAVSSTPTNHWTVWGHDFLLVCVIGSSQSVPLSVRPGSRPKAACLDMWVHCSLWASTNLTGRFLLTFPHGYVHIWVEFILPLLFVTTMFAYNPQPLSCGAPSKADIVPVVATCLLFLTLTQKLGESGKKMSGQVRLVWKPE